MNENYIIRKLLHFKSLTTIRTGGPAEYFIRPKSYDDLRDVLLWAKRRELGIFLLGNGSNIIVSDNGLKGLTVSLKPYLSNFRMDSGVLCVQAGAMWPAVADKMAKRGMRGLEAGLGIPGTIGGAVYMNAGIPGKLISDFMTAVLVMRISNGKMFRMLKSELCFGGRSSIFKQDPELIIVEAEFELVQETPRRILEEMRQGLLERKRKQPYEHSSAGCMFKRESNILPGDLIERAGCKGLAVGNASVSLKHANFIVNTGGATSSDVWLLTQEVKKRVFDKFGVHLETEVQFIGDFE